MASKPTDIPTTTPSYGAMSMRYMSSVREEANGTSSRYWCPLREMERDLFITTLDGPAWMQESGCSRLAEVALKGISCVNFSDRWINRGSLLPHSRHLPGIWMLFSRLLRQIAGGGEREAIGGAELGTYHRNCDLISGSAQVLFLKLIHSPEL